MYIIQPREKFTKSRGWITRGRTVSASRQGYYRNKHRVYDYKYNYLGYIE